MQPGFDAANRNEDAVLTYMAHIAAESRANTKEKQQHWELLAVELEPEVFVDTCCRIQAAMKTFSGPSATIIKTLANGSSAILEWIDKTRKEKNEHVVLHVCGVNSCYCVKETCESLKLSEAKGVFVHLLPRAMACYEDTPIEHNCDHSWRSAFPTSPLQAAVDKAKTAIVSKKRKRSPSSWLVRCYRSRKRSHTIVKSRGLVYDGVW